MNQNNFNTMQQPQTPQPAQLSQTQQPARRISFNADLEAYDILASVYPELIESMINISIKKFSKLPEFKELFLKAELRENHVVQDSTATPAAEVAQQSTQPQPAQQQTQPAASPLADFSSGW